MVDFPDIKVVNSPATRQGAVLDEIGCNFGDKITSCTAEPPLQTAEGTRSDHDILLIKANIPRRHHFTKRNFFHRPITEKGKDEFMSKLALVDWSFIMHLSSTEAADALAVVLDKLVHDCLPQVEIEVRSTDAPWITKKIKRWISFLKWREDLIDGRSCRKK